MEGWKPLLPFGASTVIETVVENALAVCGSVLLVTGYRGEELARLFQGRPRVLIVHNSEWELGMFSSIRRAAPLVDAERFFITLGDKPLIRPAAYEALLAAPRAAAVFAAFDGVRGHPVLLDESVRRAIIDADPASGSMKDIITRLSAHEVAWSDDSVTRDLDTREQYEEARRSISERDGP